MSKIANYCGIALLLLAIAGCSKDKFASKPSLKFKSITSYDIASKALFEIRLEYTDAEGDLSLENNGLTLLRRVVRCPSDTAKIPFRLPEIPKSKNSSGDIVLRFQNNGTDYLNAGYAAYTPASCVSSTNTDTTTFRFVLRDQAGNVSDTVSIDKPVLIRRQ